MALPMHDVEVLRAACCIAALDGEFDEREERALRRLAEKAGVGSVSLEAIKDRAKRDSNFFEEQFRILRADPKDAMTSLAGVAVADGDLTSNERVVLHHFAQRLGVSNEEFDKLMTTAEKYLRQRRPD